MGYSATHNVLGVIHPLRASLKASAPLRGASSDNTFPQETSLGQILALLKVLETSRPSPSHVRYSGNDFASMPGTSFSAFL